jgi:hypothetical protein
MRLEGRSEKRIPVMLPVCLLSGGTHQVAEYVNTGNVSPQGAQVVTKRRWQPDAERSVTAQSGGRQFSARVVYCKPISGQRFFVGLRFSGPLENWWVGQEPLPDVRRGFRLELAAEGVSL